MSIAATRFWACATDRAKRFEWYSCGLHGCDRDLGVAQAHRTHVDRIGKTLAFVCKLASRIDRYVRGVDVLTDPGYDPRRRSRRVRGHRSRSAQLSLRRGECCTSAGRVAGAKPLRCHTERRGTRTRGAVSTDDCQGAGADDDRGSDEGDEREVPYPAGPVHLEPVDICTARCRAQQDQLGGHEGDGDRGRQRPLENEHRGGEEQRLGEGVDEERAVHADATTSESVREVVGRARRQSSAVRDAARARDEDLEDREGEEGYHDPGCVDRLSCRVDQLDGERRQQEAEKH